MTLILRSVNTLPAIDDLTAASFVNFSAYLILFINTTLYFPRVEITLIRDVVNEPSFQF